jgi:preprotein translocase subunit SecA
MERIGMKPGESIEHNMVSRRIESAQEKVERHNFDIRKHLLEYDDVLNQQRTVIYKYRRNVLEGEATILSLYKEMVADVIHDIFEIYPPEEIVPTIKKLTNIKEDELSQANLSKGSATEMEEATYDFLCYYYEQYRAQLPPEVITEAEKWIMLETIDRAWRMHLQNNDQLKEGIGLRGYGQKNPLIEYKKESFDMFRSLMVQIKWDIVQGVFRMKPEDLTLSKLHEIAKEHEKSLEDIQIGGDGSVSDARTVERKEEKVGRNDPCPCGSGKKYKKCHGQ